MQNQKNFVNLSKNNTMDELKISEEQLHLVEKLGVVFEGSGLQPAAARIASLLIVSDRTELTFDEIRAVLNLSKSATSNAINLLIRLNRIDYITKPGDRKRYYKSNITDWKKDMSAKFFEMKSLQDMMREVLRQRTPETPEFNKNLEELISMMEYIFSELPKIFEKWEKR